MIKLKNRFIYKYGVISSSQMRILLLEDDIKLGPWLKINLTKMGNVTDLFSDGVQAELAIKKINYEILIIDRMIPGIDGLSLVKKIRNKPAKDKYN